MFVRDWMISCDRYRRGSTEEFYNNKSQMDFPYYATRPDLPSRCKWHLGIDSDESPHHHESYPQEKEKILPDILHQIGGTPMVKLNKIPEENDVECEIVAKCEFFNPAGSVKDRIAYRMVLEAEREGKIKPGETTLIEATSGNTGIGLALVAAIRGYKCIIVMPEKMSMEKVNILRALGAEIVRTPTKAKFDSPESHISKAQTLKNEIKHSFILDQHYNSGNPLAHYDGTAEEILEQCDGKIDMIVMGTGTGGTISGVARKIKEQCPNVTVVGVDPYGSIMAEPQQLNKTNIGYYEIEGIGYDFKPTVLDRGVIDRWVKTTDKESLLMARNLIQKEGLLCGGSSGAAVWAACQAAKKLRKDQRCVVLLPDSIRNYMSKHLTDEWMAERDFITLDDLAKHWWWDEKVNQLDLSRPLTVSGEITCQTAVEIMNRETTDQMPVVDEAGAVIGVVTLKDLMKKFISSKLTSDSKVSEALNNNFRKVSLSTSLGKLSHIFNENCYAVVMHSQQYYTDLNESSNRDIVFGVATRMDLLKFITTEKKYSS